MKPATFATLSIIATLSMPVGAQTPPDADPAIRYDEGLQIGRSEGAGSIKIGARAQGRFTSTSEGDQPATPEWSAKRLRLSAKGHLGTPRLRYYTQLAFEDGPEVRDAFADFTIVPDYLSIRAGRSKMPVSRHFLNSSGRLALVDRSITHKAFDSGRGIGVMLHDDVEGKSSFGWAVGGYLDETNRLRFAEREAGVDSEHPFEPAVAARVAFNLGGVKVTDEINWQGGPPRAGIGLYALESIDTQRDGDGRLRSGIDWIVAGGPLTLSGDVQAAFQHTLNGTVYDGVGFHQQLSWLAFGHVAPAIRFAVVEPVDDASRTESAVGVTGYLFRHRLKLGTDVVTIRSTSAPAETQLRVQAQIVL